MVCVLSVSACVWLAGAALTGGCVESGLGGLMIRHYTYCGGARVERVFLRE